MKRKLVTMLSVVMVASTIFTACGKSGEAAKETKKIDKKSSEKKEAKDPAKLPQTAKNRKDTLIVGVQTPPGNFNPIYGQTVDDQYVVNLVFDSLTANDKDGNPTPRLAEKWDLTNGDKTYTFHLRKGVKFSNGNDFTAKDVAFTYTALCDPSYDGPMGNYVEHIDGYEEYKKGNATEVKGIKVIDDNTISFTMKEVYAPSMDAFGYGVGIMPKSEYDFPKGNIQKLKDKFLTPVGSGPYKFVNFKQGQEVNLTRNDNYWNGQPKITNIILKSTNASTQIQELVSGGVDIDRIPARPENIQQLEAAGFLEEQIYPKNGYGYIGFNLRDKKFADKKVRQALTYGFDRQKFVDTYYKGYADVCHSAINTVSWAYESNLNEYKYDKDKAEKLLDEAGWKKGSDGIREKDGEKFKIKWLTYTGSKYVDTLIPILQQDWKKIGVEVVPELVEFATLSSKVTDKREFELCNMAWASSLDPDQLGTFGIQQDVPGGFNAGGFRNEESDKLLKEGIAVTDKAKRKEVYSKWQKLVNDELPYIFLDSSKEMFSVSSKVKNMDISTYVNWTMNIDKVELQ
ncbi:peptide/nickel transport system substrate-binding protein [Clostridium cavendishii DSM 21758]|uniref:Peptide/nickel transport system substrate-binding protein n=1 Tax=Clostridium cavendishii DSM 21758 TaxID=1121302 RepID=A0A1M6LHH3_9CLOT|nr:ABC transporter substrate-binding protein [Clostridium cavendishii]SHJ70640.1 peptide/nickel transport system substrate-binding protein [Clostridium cavendishii DSM 21758]